MGNMMASTSKRSGTSRAKKTTVAHSSTRARGGRPPRQRHSQASAAHRARTAASSRPGKNSKYWSHHVMETSDAMDIEKDIFRTGTADEIAQSLKRSSTRSKRRKGTPYQSAMSMLNFYINRAGRNLPKSRKTTLEQAKRKLREAFGRSP
ncbi:DUF3175 domain-containing protein [Paraburkholderia terrae]|uniref:DUF3175 domain-containing protein n=1 Tax=Paraburkholderia terrae TaxID=311230 RepID=UPI00296A9288|nr:DUF3175 domain-containing protein [Paraburkholderia terrae]MDW3658387.1 DUF3175 domain-containing protein [Paraburkholderia terrae]